MSQLEQLQSMFNNLSVDVLQSVLAQNGNDMNKAIDACLSFSATASTAPTAAKASISPRPSPKPSLTTTAQKVVGMISDPHAKQLAGKHGLGIMNVAWEDNARTKNSCWGPCISDMTLRVENYSMPLIRSPNYTDLTWDVPIEKIPLVVGNERGGPLYTVTLKEYLEHFRLYLHSSATGTHSSLLAPRDSHVIMSSQACFLPVVAGDEAKFNVAIYNYQSTRNDPAVLAIVSTVNGTSAQILDGTHGGQKLFFNSNGQKASFLAQRLSDNRKERGAAAEGPMTTQEKQQNMIMIIQVPLRQHTRHQRIMPMMEMDCLESCAAPSMMAKSCSVRTSNVEDAIIKVGASEGSFEELRSVNVERDPSFPVRVTLQFYKCTDNGVVDEEDITTIANQIQNSRKNADFIGSLVVGGNTNRPTEHHQQPILYVPPWWSNFWLTYKNLVPASVNEEKAKQMLFTTTRYKDSSLPDVQNQVLSTLGANQLNWML